MTKAVALVTKFRNQHPPEDCTNEQFKEWEGNKLTTTKVLGIIRKYIINQYVIPRKEVALVKTNYGFKLKQYAPRLLDGIKHRSASINDLVLGRVNLPIPPDYTPKIRKQIKAAERLIGRRDGNMKSKARYFPKWMPIQIFRTIWIMPPLLIRNTKSAVLPTSRNKT